MAEHNNEPSKQHNGIPNRDITLAADGEALEEGIAQSNEVKEDAPLTNRSPAATRNHLH